MDAAEKQHAPESMSWPTRAARFFSGSKLNPERKPGSNNWACIASRRNIAKC
jgi:hypothetical protein